MKWTTLIFSTFTVVALFANPHPREDLAPKDAPRNIKSPLGTAVSQWDLLNYGVDVLRIQVDWSEKGELYQLGPVVKEASGTPALIRRSVKKDPLGSYHGVLVDPATGWKMAFSSIGTGSEFRKLSRSMTFRFPIPSGTFQFVLTAENPLTGQMEEVLRETIDPSQVVAAPKFLEKLDVRLLRQASVNPELVMNIYAEGYPESGRERFFEDAQAAIDALEENEFPGQDKLTFFGVFAPSNKELGKAKNLGSQILERDSFLGLYFPYWNNFGRWYHVVYPTRQHKYRTALGQLPYDYPLILVDSDDYWGVGNFNELTAIPASNSSFTYLLLHEMGHFFGLNEEYESGGKTELAFSPGIPEPWSQNITFLSRPDELKWKHLIQNSTPVPTPSQYWKGDGPYGAYRGGYAQTQPLGKSHKPGKSCVMNNGRDFCPICHHALKERFRFDLGL